MRLPKFWKDTGGWNDTVVTMAVVISISSGLLLSIRHQLIVLALGSIILGPIIGFISGLFAVVILCKLFGKR